MLVLKYKKWQLQLSKPLLTGIVVGSIIFLLGTISFLFYYQSFKNHLQQDDYKRCLARALQSSRQFYQTYCQKNSQQPCDADNLNDNDLADILDFYQQAEIACQNNHLVR